MKLTLADWCHGNEDSWRVREIVEKTGFPPVFMGFVTIYQYRIGPKGGLYRRNSKMLANPKIYCRQDLGQPLPFPEPTWCEECGFVFTGGFQELDYEVYRKEIEKGVKGYGYE